MKLINKRHALIFFVAAAPWFVVLSVLAVMNSGLTDTLRIGLISLSAATGALQAWAMLTLFKSFPTQVHSTDRNAQLDRVTDELHQTQRALAQWISLDMIERRQTEDQLIEANRLESVAVSTSGIAHDFNNILTAILGNVSLAKLYAPENDKLIKRLSKAEKAVVRAQDLTRQLLTMTNGGQPVKQLGSIREVIQDVVDFSLQGAHVRYELAIAEELWPVEMDPGQISQVIHNLIINADHAMPEGGVIRVSAANLRTDGDTDPKRLRSLKPGPYIEIVVRDEGIGIEASHLQHIFDPYFTTKNQGHGLGLSNASAIMNKHHGAIHVESEVGSGTTFYLYLPATPDRCVMTPPDATLPPQAVTT